MRAVCVCMALASVAAVSACTPNPENPSVDVDPDRPGPVTPIDPDNPNTPEEPTTPEVTHSQLLYDVLNNSEYNALIENYQADASVRNLQQYDPIPYGFFEERGYNIADIKNNTLRADAVAYIKDSEPNNLYIATKVEETGFEQPFYACYTLKYTLTNEEVNDLNYIHESQAIQAPFFILELSYQKEATVESEVNIFIETYDAMIDDFSEYYSDQHEAALNTTDIAMDLNNINLDGNSITCTIRPRRTDEFTTKVAIGTANLAPSRMYISVQSWNNTYIYSAPVALDFASEEEMQNYMNNATPVTYYDTQDKTEFNFSLQA